MPKVASILIIDDDPAIRNSCQAVLEKENYNVEVAENGQKGLHLFAKAMFHVVLLDLKMPGISGMEILKKIKEKSPETPVIIITGYASIESAVDAMKNGAFNYLPKPFIPAELRLVVAKAVENRQFYFEKIYLQGEVDKLASMDMVVGKGKNLKDTMEIVKRVSPSESTILITGESGTGKELIARQIHRLSLRSNAPFVVIDCGALVESLFESELFGHVKGSFTGAHETKHGLFEVANGGTIFLDEISNISLNIQAKLLRVIQEREITRVGSTKPIRVDVRIIAATNVDLAHLVKTGKFREDLFYRLNVVPIHLPPLRERKEDIPALADYFLQKYNQTARKKISAISDSVKRTLSEYNWPGNIRELENTVERAVVLSRGDTIELQDLIYHGISADVSAIHSSSGRYKSLEEIEKEHIIHVLQAMDGNKSRTAKILGIDRKTLISKIKKYKVE
ncbi:MAG: sigma-54-dependent Fis family transcriptional regulator [Candidatus Aminicenantes bacterium]|nr:sigma-54-dependent Fis family transcriptional regulator [Candidatus Aminicenantes bacterium]